MRNSKILLGISLLICLFVASGCGAFTNQKKDEASEEELAAVTEEIEEMPLEVEKEQLLRSIDRKYENPEAHYRLGRIYQKQNLLAQAEHEYTLALSFDPVHREAQASRVKVLMDSGDATEAQMSANFYINQAKGSAVGSLKLGLMFQEYGLDEYALRCYNQALSLAPNSAKVCRQIGYYHLSKGNQVQAQEYLRRSFQLNPNQPDVARQLGKMGVVVEVPKKKAEDGKILDRIVDKFRDKE